MKMTESYLFKRETKTMVISKENTEPVLKINMNGKALEQEIIISDLGQ